MISRACWLPIAGLLAPLLAFELVDSRYANPSDWLSYDRDNTCRRYSPLSQIDTGNVKHLSANWVFQFARMPPRSESTPLVSNGILYLTVGGEEAFALDARNGRVLWEFNYPTPPAEAAGSTRRTNWNRGFAISGNRLFMADRRAEWQPAVAGATGESGG
jgi:quinohemoprotein ethanol dehydrogenase